MAFAISSGLRISPLSTGIGEPPLEKEGRRRRRKRTSSGNAVQVTSGPAHPRIGTSGGGLVLILLGPSRRPR
ncbi:MAG: hypothetical protein R6T98_08125, partial [Desulfatiglandales bacterium]